MVNLYNEECAGHMNRLEIPWFWSLRNNFFWDLLFIPWRNRLFFFQIVDFQNNCFEISKEA
jgi:hypothetical protein